MSVWISEEAHVKLLAENARLQKRNAELLVALKQISEFSLDPWAQDRARQAIAEVVDEKPNPVENDPFCCSRAELEELNAELLAALKKIWDLDDMGWIYGGEPHPLFGLHVECGSCGGKGETLHSVLHDEGCAQGIIHCAIAKAAEGRG